MKFFFISLTCTIIFLFSKALVSGQELNLKLKLKSCREFVSDLTKRQMRAIPNCIKILGLKSGQEKAGKKNCILKCALMTEGIFNPEGYMDSQTVIKFIENQAPLKDRARITQLFFTCTTFGNLCIPNFTPRNPKLLLLANLIDPGEENCKTYEGVIKCLMSLGPRLCQG